MDPWLFLLGVRGSNFPLTTWCWLQSGSGSVSGPFRAGRQPDLDPENTGSITPLISFQREANEEYQKEQQEREAVQETEEAVIAQGGAAAENTI